MNPINLNELLRIKDLENTKIRLIMMADHNWTPVEFFRNKQMESLTRALYWNYNKKVFKVGEVVIGLLKISPKDDLWLLFHIGLVTKDLHLYNGEGYTYQQLAEYEQYFGRVIVKYKNRAQTLIRKAGSIIGQCDVYQVLPDVFDDDIFLDTSK